MMGFLSPLVFLLAIPLAGVIIALYLLKLKRKERVISSVFLWKQAIQDVQANAPFQKLKKNLLLFIQLAVIVLAVVALARPFARTTGLAGQNIVIIIDSSASMSATDSGKSRFDEARQKALAAVDRMGKGDSILVITSSA
ncbi:MAG TPA: BatA and WFA domain-containing protein, partial [Armatimonadota bacterium]|nr:BatA and WFA domain-containing protein [Armatimonadota bacterium]